MAPYLFLIDLGDGENGFVAISADFMTDTTNFRGTGQPRPGTFTHWYNPAQMLADARFAGALCHRYSSPCGVHFGRIVFDFGRAIGWDALGNIVNHMVLHLVNTAYRKDGGLPRWECALHDARPFNPRLTW